MRKILSCRRSIIAMFGITCLTAISIIKGIDCSSAIAAISLGVAGANSAEGILKKRPE